MIQPLLLDDLLIIDNQNTKAKNKLAKIDFLLELLKNIDDDSFKKELILKSNLSKDEKAFLINKLKLKSNDFKFKSDKNFNKNNLKEFIKNIENKVENKIESFKNKNIELHKEKLKIDKKDDKNLISLEVLLQNDININSENLVKKIEKLPKKTHLKIVREIKNIIISKSKVENKVVELINLKEFKEVKNIKQLVNLAKKFDLNLEKIVFSKIKRTNINEQMIKPQKLKPLSQIKLPQIKQNIQNIAQKIVLNKQNVEEIENKVNLNSLLTLNKDEKKDDNKILNDNKVLVSNTISEFKQKIFEAKQSIKHFVSSLKEAIENYKPPLTKLTLELHPKELGKVEVVIKHQGDNLNIQINTQNQTTINFLTTQQQELKNSLVNMGFTNINMNFNSNHNQKRERPTQPQHNFQKIEDEEELIIDFTYKYA